MALFKLTILFLALTATTLARPQVLPPDTPSPAGPVEPVKPVESLKSTGSSESAEPTEPIPPMDPIKPMKPMDMEPMKPLKPIESIESGASEPSTFPGGVQHPPSHPFVDTGMFGNLVHIFPFAPMPFGASNGLFPFAAIPFSGSPNFFPGYWPHEGTGTQLPHRNVPRVPHP